MEKQRTVRFWIETALATVSGILLAVTLVWRAWMETISGFEPDQSSGSLEWIITGALLAATIALVYVARREYKQAQADATRA